MKTLTSLALLVTMTLSNLANAGTGSYVLLVYGSLQPQAVKIWVEDADFEAGRGFVCSYTEGLGSPTYTLVNKTFKVAKRGTGVSMKYESLASFYEKFVSYDLATIGGEYTYGELFPEEINRGEKKNGFQCR